jgi:hypothetical protein
MKISKTMIVNSCYTCDFLTIDEFCELTKRDVVDDDTDNPRRPSWCPLNKEPVIIESIYKKPDKGTV